MVRVPPFALVTVLGYNAEWTGPAGERSAMERGTRVTVVQGTAGAIVALASLSCATVRPVPHPAEFIARAHPEIVAVTYKDGSQIPVAKPHMSGDTLIGIWDGLGEPVAVPLIEVQQIDARQRSKSRTTFLIGGLTAVTAMGVFVLVRATRSGANCDYTYTPDEVTREARCLDNRPPT